MRLYHLPLALLLAGTAAGSAGAEPFCRTVLADGRVVLSEPLRGVNGLFCPSAAAVRRMPPEIGGSTLPSTRFTTGPIGPFTTGNLPPVTTGNLPPVTGGSLPPLTTFSNSAPATRR
jgi:hypothetical protein